MVSLRKINGYWTTLIGSPGAFALEARIFHSICIITLLALAYNVPFNYAIGLPLLSLISFIVLILFSCLYYLSRFKNKVEACIITGCIIGNILFISNYFLNSGISGPTDILMAVALLLTLSVSSKQEYKIWIPVNIAIVVTLHAIEYHYPGLVPNTYSHKANRFVDISSAYIVVIILMYYTINYIRRNYDYEKRSAENKAQSIESKNKYILVQNLELERLNEEKSKLMSIIAHDLRAPLGNIQNYLELLNEYDLQSDERKLIESDLLKLTQNTTYMLSKLLTWSKSQMDGVTVKLVDVNLSEALHSTLEIEKAIAHKKGITLTYKIDPQIDVKADGDMLQLVIRNLLNNAIKFTPIGGNVYVATKIFNSECHIIVKDNGTGISYEQQKDLFSLKARSTYGTDNEKGIGLGLLLCKEFTELQDGNIWLNSEPGNGTTFFVSLPLSS